MAFVALKIVAHIEQDMQQLFILFSQKMPKLFFAWPEMTGVTERGVVSKREGVWNKTPQEIF